MVSGFEARYDRQVRLITPERQQKLAAVKVAVVGSGRLSDYVVADLLCFGVNAVRRVGWSDRFEFDKINPGVVLEQVGEELDSAPQAEMHLDGMYAVIDATNDPRSKMFSSACAGRMDKTYLSGSSTSHGFSLAQGGSVKDIPGFHGLCEAERCQGQGGRQGEQEQGELYAIIAGAMLADELRKRVAPLEKEILFGCYSYNGVEEPRGLKKKVLQVGAGAIGTFSALALCAAGCEVTLIDHDTVEESNLNRQFLFYDKMGFGKAATLADRLNVMGLEGVIVPRQEKVVEGFDPKGYDFVFSCVDNNEARYQMNEACRRTGVPMINGGSGDLSGHSMSYVPGKTACLDCQLGGLLTKAHKD